MTESKQCGFQAFGFMPACALAPGHTGYHEDGLGGCYGNRLDKRTYQIMGSKELRYKGE